MMNATLPGWTAPSFDEVYALISKEAKRARDQIVISAPRPAAGESWIVRTVVTRQRPFAPMLQRLDAFADLGTDWDSYGGVPISDVAMKTARTLLNDLSYRALASSLVPHHIAPISTGGVQIEWRRPEGNALEVWIDDEGHIELLRDEPSSSPRFHEKGLPNTAVAVAEVESFAA